MVLITPTPSPEGTPRTVWDHILSDDVAAVALYVDGNEDEQTAQTEAARQQRLRIQRSYDYRYGQAMTIHVPVGLLNFAVLFGTLRMVKYFVEDCGLSPNDVFISPNDYNNALHAASERGDLEILRYLVEERGADLTLLSGGGADSHVVHYAAQSGHVNILAYLLEGVVAEGGRTERGQKGASGATDRSDGEKCVPPQGDTPLKVAERNAAMGRSGHKFTIHTRRCHAFDVDQTVSAGGHAAVHFAAMQGHHDALRYLCGEGEDGRHRRNLNADARVRASMTTRDHSGRTVLHHAAMWGHAKIVQYVVPRMLHAALPQLTPTASLSCRMDDIMQGDRSLHTPLSLALDKGHTQIAAFLLDPPPMAMEVCKDSGRMIPVMGAAAPLTRSNPAADDSTGDRLCAPPPCTCSVGAHAVNRSNSTMDVDRPSNTRCTSITVEGASIDPIAAIVCGSLPTLKAYIDRGGLLDHLQPPPALSRRYMTLVWDVPFPEEDSSTSSSCRSSAAEEEEEEEEEEKDHSCVEEVPNLALIASPPSEGSSSAPSPAPARDAAIAQLLADYGLDLSLTHRRKKKKKEQVGHGKHKEGGRTRNNGGETNAVTSPPSASSLLFTPTFWAMHGPRVFGAFSPEKQRVLRAEGMYCIE